MRVFYLTGAQFALNNVALRRIKISRFSDLNDPFELLAVDLSDREHRAAFHKTKKEINENKGLICFSKSWRNPLLWGHYAEKHTGICLGFGVLPDELLTPAIYNKYPMKIKIDPQTNLPIVTEQMMLRLLSTKFADWKYEDEVRLFVKLDHDTIESCHYFYSFSGSFVLREIILGPRCEIPIGDVRRLAEYKGHPVEVIKSRLAVSTFDVVKDRSASKIAKG